MNDDRAIDCWKLPGRLRQICTGEAGIPEGQRQRYIRAWRERGLLADRGFGDKLERFIHSVMPARLLHFIKRRGCRCSKRVEWLNKLFPNGGENARSR